ncbi:MAG: hypothetical protein FWG35_01205, partial [Spirochaetaceae bacterium]|nr:hypothetical protein [Spirochaetaceae bacterium]
MKKGKIVYLVCVCLLAGMLLAGCGGSGSSASSDAGGKFEYKLGSNTADGQVITITMQWLCDELKARTNGNFIIDFFPNNLLGAEVPTRDMVSEGTLEMANVGFGILTPWEPAI